MNDQIEKRVKAIELASRFALIGEDAMVSLARAELFLDFLNDGKKPQDDLTPREEQEL